MVKVILKIFLVSALFLAGISTVINFTIKQNFLIAEGNSIWLKVNIDRQVLKKDAVDNIRHASLKSIFNWKNFQDNFQNFKTVFFKIDIPRIEVSNKKIADSDYQILKGDLFAATSSALLVTEAGDEIFSIRPHRVRPLASITKLMTALVFLDQKISDNKKYKITDKDRGEFAGKNFLPGEEVKVKDLFYASLVGSDNTATIALAKSTGMTIKQFVVAMNEKGRRLGLVNTRFQDVTGLTTENISTAWDVSQFAKSALGNKKIIDAVTRSEYNFQVGGKKRIVRTTDNLLSKEFDLKDIKFIGGKTGFIDEAGYCFVSRFADKNNKKIISVVMGLPTIDSRFTETEKMVRWYYK